MPALPPVTSATLPASLLVIVISWWTVEAREPSSA
jgi:hypothetical protein